jgi:hypothetical protein
VTIYLPCEEFAKLLLIHVGSIKQNFSKILAGAAVVIVLGEHC